MQYKREIIDANDMVRMTIGEICVYVYEQRNVPFFAVTLCKGSCLSL